MKKTDLIKKRLFDLSFAFLGLCVLWPILLLAVPLARLSTGASGIYSQRRIGQAGKLFTVYKIRTMRANQSADQTTVTTENDVRITGIGNFFRRTKIDEIPQLWNVLMGDMSLVGPRPDVPGYADLLTGDDRRILDLKPGITGPATIKYRYEERLLASVELPEEFNANVIYPDKVGLNLLYADNWSMLSDIRLILMTLKIIPCSDALSPPVSVSEDTLI